MYALVAGEEVDEVSKALTAQRELDLAALKAYERKVLAAATYWPCFGATAAEQRRLRAAEKVLLEEERWDRLAAENARKRDAKVAAAAAANAAALSAT